MDRYESMHVFIQVAELLSFSRAAESLNLPKPTVSNSIQYLEELVGTKLLNRTTRSVQLTPEGISFLERCKDLLSDMEEAEAMFKNDSHQIKGKVRIDMAVPTARDLIVPQLPEFFEKYPNIEIELSSTDRKVDLVREGIDCVVRAGKVSEPGLVEKDLGLATIVNVASPTYLAKYGKPKNIADLAKHRLIHFSQVLGSKPEGFEYFDGEKYREVKMPGVLTVNNIDAYIAACVAGLGIAQNPLIGVAKELKQGSLSQVLPKLQAEPLPIKLVYQQKRMLSLRVRIFMDWIEPLLREMIRDGAKAE